jgi:formylglycine-generating enzyme required for sulfatase activity
VAWQDAKDYADWLSQQTGKTYRLPTESEWEYAARSEGKDDIWAGTSDEEELKNYAVYAKNSHNRTAPVGETEGRKPNAIGLYDMSGNVFEWVEDCVHQDYRGAPMDGTAWLEAGGGDCHRRVFRGSSWFGRPVMLRASSRSWSIGVYRLGQRFDYIGFRLARTLTDPLPSASSRYPWPVLFGTSSDEEDNPKTRRHMTLAARYMPCRLIQIVSFR